MKHKTLAQPVVINGNTITEGDLSTLRNILTSLESAAEYFDLLSPGVRQFLYDLHTEDTQLAHIVRWGPQNCEEAIVKIIDAAKSEGPAHG